MSVVAAAIIGSAVVGVAATTIGAKEQKEGVEAGVESQEKISTENIELQKELADQQREDFAPWRDVGEQALTNVWEGVQSGAFDPGKFVAGKFDPRGIDAKQFDVGKFDPSKVDVTKDPGYKFRLEQGIEARDKSAASRGRLLSGAQAKGIEEYGQGVASQEYGNAYSRALGEYAVESGRQTDLYGKEVDRYGRDVNKLNTQYGRDVNEYASEADRKNREFNILSQLSQGGQSSAARQAGATSQLASTSGNIMANLGQSQNQAQQNIGNANASAYQGTAQSVNQAAQNWLAYKQMGA